MSKLEWDKEPMGGWNRYTTKDGYVIEKEDDYVFAVWFGGEEIGVMDTVQGAKKIARQHHEAK